MAPGLPLKLRVWADRQEKSKQSTYVGKLLKLFNVFTIKGSCSPRVQRSELSAPGIDNKNKYLRTIATKGNCLLPANIKLLESRGNELSNHRSEGNYQGTSTANRISIPPASNSFFAKSEGRANYEWEFSSLAIVNKETKWKAPKFFKRVVDSL